MAKANLVFTLHFSVAILVMSIMSYLPSRSNARATALPKEWWRQSNSDGTNIMPRFTLKSQNTDGFIKVTSRNGVLITKQKPDTAALSDTWQSQFKLCPPSANSNLCQPEDTSCIFKQKLCVFDPTDLSLHHIRYDKMHKIVTRTDEELYGKDDREASNPAIYVRVTNATDDGSELTVLEHSGTYRLMEDRNYLHTRRYQRFISQELSVDDAISFKICSIGESC